MSTQSIPRPILAEPEEAAEVPPEEQEVDDLLRKIYGSRLETNQLLSGIAAAARVVLLERTRAGAL